MGKTSKNNYPIFYCISLEEAFSLQQLSSFGSNKESPFCCQLSVRNNNHHHQYSYASVKMGSLVCQRLPSCCYSNTKIRAIDQGNTSPFESRQRSPFITGIVTMNLMKPSVWGKHPKTIILFLLHYLRKLLSLHIREDE